MSSTNSLNYLFVKRFVHLVHIFVPFSRLSLNVENHHEHFYSHPLILIFLLLINEVGLQFIIYFVGLLPKEFYSQLSKSPDKRDFPAFRWLIIRSFAYVTLNAFLKSFSTFFSSILYIKWRGRLVTYLHSFYFTQQRYYHLLNTTQQNQINDNHDHRSAYQNHAIQTTDFDDKDRDSIHYMPTDSSIPSVSLKQSIDNPDQRITQDGDSLCRSLSTILPLILISPFTIGYYSYLTWQVTGYYGPLGILIYFIIWTGLNKMFISSVSRTIFRQNNCEGNFRFLHTQIRIYNEPIAFYNGGLFEHTRFNSYFIKILSPILYNRSRREFALSLSTNLYDYIGSIINYLLLALAIFVFHLYDNLTLDELVQKISETSFTTGYLIYCFNKLNDLTSEVSLIAANTHRVQSFIEFMKNIHLISPGKQFNETIQQNQVLIIKNLSYSTPNNNTNILMKNLNLILNQGQRLLITGDSGIGKSSFFRVLHSLWPVNINGSFSYESTHAYLLPQRCYFTNRSLSDELSYPDIENLPSITRQWQIEEFLTEWNLSHILNCVESSIYTSPKYAWQDLLSPGELQRLSFIRLILRLSSNEHARINLIFLDEITSSIDRKMEMKMYNYLIERNLTLISIGHRETLRQYHQIELHLQENGNYIITNI